MKHFWEHIKKYYISAFLPMLLLLIVLFVFVIAAEQVDNSQSHQESQILSQALERSITQCYALEGAYPSSLSYLVEHYGLTYDSDHYYIDYQYIGSNLRPNVMIIERK